MDELDPHLKILLADFGRLCPDDAPLEQDHWNGLYEITLFVHEQGIRCPASMMREYMIHHGCSPRKAAYLSHQYGQFLHILRLRDERTHAAGRRVDETGTAPSN